MSVNSLKKQIKEACKYGPEAVDVVLNDHARWNYYVGRFIEDKGEPIDIHAPVTVPQVPDVKKVTLGGKTYSVDELMPQDQ